MIICDHLWILYDATWLLQLKYLNNAWISGVYAIPKYFNISSLSVLYRTYMKLEQLAKYTG